MTYRTQPKKIDVSFKRPRLKDDGAMSGTTMAGAITGGTIGAFTAGPIGTVAGMVIGGIAARALTRYVHEDTKAPTSRPASPK